MNQKTLTWACDRYEKNIPGKCRGRLVMRTEDNVKWYFEKRRLHFASELICPSDLFSLYVCKAWTNNDRHFSWYCFSDDISSKALCNTCWISSCWSCFSIYHHYNLIEPTEALTKAASMEHLLLTKNICFKWIKSNTLAISTNKHSTSIMIFQCSQSIHELMAAKL